MTLSDEIRSTPEGLKVFNQERVLFEVTEAVFELMDEQGISFKELGMRLDPTQMRLVQMLQIDSGIDEMTLGEIADIFLALGREISVNVNK